MDHVLNLLLADGVVAESSGFTELIVAAALVIVAGVAGLSVGYFLGQRTGKLAGELEALKSMRRGKGRSGARPSNTSTPLSSQSDDDSEG